MCHGLLHCAHAQHEGAVRLLCVGTSPSRGAALCRTEHPTAAWRHVGKRDLLDSIAVERRTPTVGENGPNVSNVTLHRSVLTFKSFWTLRDQQEPERMQRLQLRIAYCRLPWRNAASGRKFKRIQFSDSTGSGRRIDPATWMWRSRSFRRKRIWCEPNELLDFPVDFLVIRFELLGNTGQRPFKVGRRQVESSRYSAPSFDHLSRGSTGFSNQANLDSRRSGIPALSR